MFSDPNFAQSYSVIRDKTAENVEKMMIYEFDKFSGRPKHSASPYDANHNNMVDRNNIKSAAGVLANLIEYGAKKAFYYSPMQIEWDAYKDMADQQDAAKTAISAVELGFGDYISENFDGNAEQLKVDIARYIMDGSLPGENDDYDSSVKEWGEFIIDTDKDNLDTKKELKSDR